MSDELTVNKTRIRLIRDDITDLEIESFVFYAREDLALGSGFGNAISMRGGPSIQDELNKIGGLKPGESIVTDAGNMKASYIVHAVGPKFQEEDMNGKLRDTIRGALERAKEKGISMIAFPAMGAGFYGVPLPDCAKVSLDTVTEYLKQSNGFKEIIFCLNDSREFDAFRSRLAVSGESGGGK